MRHFILSILFVSVLNAQGFIIHYDSPAEGEEAPACTTVVYDYAASVGGASVANLSFAHTFGTDASCAIIIHAFSSGIPTITSCTADGNAATFIDSAYKDAGSGYYMCTYVYKYLTPLTGEKTIACTLAASAVALNLACVSATCVSDVEGGDKHYGQGASASFDISSSVGNIPLLAITWNSTDAGCGGSAATPTETLTWDPVTARYGKGSRTTGSASVNMSFSFTQSDDCEEGYTYPVWSGIIFQFVP